MNKYDPNEENLRAVLHSIVESFILAGGDTRVAGEVLSDMADAMAMTIQLTEAISGLQTPISMEVVEA